MVRDLSGGVPAEIYRSAGPMAIPRWSHSGHKIALSVSGAALVFSRFGGEPVRIATGGAHLSWSPDDTELILGAAGAKWFWIASTRTSEVRRVEISGPLLTAWVTHLSPDGERLLLCGRTEAESGVWSIRKDGSDLRRIAREEGPVFDAKWAPDGKASYYVAQIASGLDLRHARALINGRDPSPLTALPGLIVGQPITAITARPNISVTKGGRLAFARLTHASNLWSADVALSRSGKELIPLRATLTGPPSQAPKLSPDGTRIAFTRQDGELGQVLLATADGEIQKTVVARKGAAGEVAWSPDGAGIAFTFTDEGGPRLYAWSAATGSERIIAEGQFSHLTWAPGSRIAGRTADIENIVFVDPTSGAQESLLKEADKAFVFSPGWSHRGDRIALYYNGRTKKGVRGFVVVSHPERSVKVILDTDDLTRPIGWSNDDTVIYAIRQSGELLAIRSDGPSTRIMGTFASRGLRAHAIEVNGKLRLALSIPEDHGDIWVVDNFDGGRR